MSITIDGRSFDYLTLRHGRGPLEGIDILGWGTYPEGSVLEGQTSKTFIDNVPDEATAREKYPQAEGFSNAFTEPQVCLSHLPGPDDQATGGAWPDDIGG